MCRAAPIGSVVLRRTAHGQHQIRERDLAASGEWVYATLTQEWKVRATGKVLSMRDGVHRFRIKNGKVVEWRGFEDTALTCEALGL